MKVQTITKTIGLGAGLLLCCGASNAQDAFVPALLGPAGPVQGLTTTLTTANPAPLVNGLVGADSGLAQGRVGAGVNSVLTGLLVNQDPGQIAAGLQFLVDPSLIGSDGVLAALLGSNPTSALPGLGALPGLPALPGLAALPMLPALP